MKKHNKVIIFLAALIGANMLYASTPWQGAKCTAQNQQQNPKSCIRNFYECCYFPYVADDNHYFWVKTPVDPHTSAAIDFACSAERAVANYPGGVGCSATTKVKVFSGGTTSLPSGYEIVDFYERPTISR